MPIVDARDLFEHAAAQRYRLPLVAPRDLHDALAWITEADRLGAPMVLDLTVTPTLPAGWEQALSAVEAAAGHASAPVVLHRGGIVDESGLARAIRVGCTSISAAPAAPAGVVAMARELGLAVVPDDVGEGSPFASPAAAHPGRPAYLESTGKAGPALAACRQWHPVEHVVMFNPAGLSDDGVRNMLRIGTDMLGSIPGVRSVRTGRALNDGSRYTLCWLVLFANERVVAHYRDHPTHTAFADSHFRPFAGDRMTIDFQLT